MTVTETEVLVLYCNFFKITSYFEITPIIYFDTSKVLLEIL